MRDNKPQRRSGRPSQSQAEKLKELILDIATERFLTEGYGTTSIEAIAKRAGISKRTFYHRFDDKADLFGAVVHRLIDRLRPPQNARLFEGKSLEEILVRLTKVVLRAALAPQALALHRMILAESTRFPELVAVVEKEGGRQEAIKRIANFLENEPHFKNLKAGGYDFIAEQFLNMVISSPQRRALGLGASMNAAELDDWAERTVNLFLHGCK